MSSGACKHTTVDTGSYHLHFRVPCNTLDQNMRFLTADLIRVGVSHVRSTRLTCIVRVFST